MLRHLAKVVSQLPSTPAIYALYGGRGRGLHVAYVGIAEKLRGRINQHLIRRDSSVTTGTSAVALNPDLVSEIHWWLYPDFSQREVLEAAEQIAFQVLNPALRSRGGVTGRAQDLLKDGAFCERIGELFRGSPSGKIIIPDLQDALDHIAELEQRLAALEQQRFPEP